MERYQEIEGDLIKLALTGNFEVIAHGCNCFNTMGAGIAPQIAKAFAADRFHLEHPSYHQDKNKLGQIDYAYSYIKDKEVPIVHVRPMPNYTAVNNGYKRLTVVNAYTQFGMGQQENGSPALDYEALILCFRKMNHYFKEKHIGLPQIGCGLAGGDWDKVKAIIKKELKDCQVTVVIFKNTNT